MPDKYSFSFVQKEFKKIGLILLENKYIGCKIKMKAETEDGYLVSKSLDDVLSKENSLITKKDNHCPVSKHNPYSIENIKKCMEKNNIPYEILSTEYKDRMSPLKFRDKDGYLYEKCWDELKNLIARREKKKYRGFSIFGNGNPYTIDNIKNYLRITEKNLVLISEKFESSKSPLEFEDNDGYKYTLSLELLKQVPKRVTLNKGDVVTRGRNKVKSRKEARERHKEFVNKVVGYEYINSYFENDLIISGYDIKIVPEKRVYIEVKHLLCGNTYLVQASQFMTQNKRCGKCCANYEDSLEYYVQQVLGENINNFYSEDDNEGVKAGTISYKSSSKEYNFKCSRNKNHKLYKTTPELFINSFNNTRSCNECVREYKKDSCKQMNEKRRKYTPENIMDRISKSKINNQLDLKSIERSSNCTIINLTCRKHPEQGIKISSTAFNKNIDEKILCKHCGV